MSQAPSVAFAVVDSESVVPPPALVTLKGTTRGLEIQVASAASAEALADRLTELLAEAPGFFAGSDARVTFDGALPIGALACLEAVAAKFQLVLLEVAPATRPPRSYAAVVRRVDEVRKTKLAEGSGPAPAPKATELLAADLAPVDVAPAPVEVAPVVAEPATVAAAPMAEDAAPVEVALANTAPYLIEAELATATSIATISVATISVAADVALLDDAPEIEVVAAAPDPAVVAAATAMAEDLALSMAGDVIERRARELAAHMASQMADTLAAERAQILAEAMATERARALADTLVPALVEQRAAELAESLAEAKAAKLVEARAAELASKLADVMANDLADIRAARLAAERAPALAAELAEALAETKASQILAALPVSPKVVIGPVRSGVIVDHAGHVIVIGDVNPGAEVRANGSIIVLGRLRGVAHAAIGREAGAIIALSFQPQQLRIGRMVARAGANDRPSDGAEIAYLTGETIVVERFLGRLPSGLAASM